MRKAILLFILLSGCTSYHEQFLQATEQNKKLQSEASEIKKSLEGKKIFNTGPVTDQAIIASFDRLGFKYKKQDNGSFAVQTREGIVIGFMLEEGIIRGYVAFKKKIPVSAVNEWNAQVNYCKAFVDGDGDAALVMDLFVGLGWDQDLLNAFIEGVAFFAITYREFVVSSPSPILL